MKLSILPLLLVSLSSAAFAETIPTPPTKYFDDRMGAISAQDAEIFNTKLEALEKNTPGNPQFVISVLKFDTDSSLEDYCNRIAKSWKVGQKDKNNGVILFWFPETRKLRFEVGYGLEGFLTDAGTKRILSSVVVPAFKSKNYAKGLGGAIDAVEKKLVSAGEESAPAAKEEGASKGPAIAMILLVFIVIFGFTFYIYFSCKKLPTPLPTIACRARAFVKPPITIKKKSPPGPTPPRRKSSSLPVIAATAAVLARRKREEPKKKKDTGSSNSGDSGFGGFGGGSSSGGSSFGGGGGDFGGAGSSDSY